MAVFVINEWLWADAVGDNGAEAQGEAYELITRLADSNHQIVVLEGSRFDQKGWGICRNTQSLVIQRLATQFVKNLRQNLDRCHLLKPDDILPLPTGLSSKVKSDDHYLVQCLIAVPGAILVTTDGDLCEVVVESGQACISRKEFLARLLQGT